MVLLHPDYEQKGKLTNCIGTIKNDLNFMTVFPNDLTPVGRINSKTGHNC